MLKANFFLLTLIVLIILGCNYLSKTEQENITKEDIYKSFVQSVNTKDSVQIKRQILAHWSDTLIGKNDRWLETDINYWLAANKEFGPLEFVSFGKDTFNQNEVAWFKGKISRDWIGLEFDFSKQNKITGTNVLRSCIPSKTKFNETKPTNQKYSQLLKEYFIEMEKSDLFSGMVLVAKGDTILYEGYHGFADKEKKEPIDSNNRMVIASTTKMFTAIAIARLVAQKKMNLQTTVSSYLKDFPKEIGNKITLANLLTHTSGIELDDMDGFTQEIKKARNVNEFYEINLKYLPKLSNFQSFSPLTQMNYSNENFDILGRLIEQVSGQDFYEYLEQHLFKPMSMDNTKPLDMNTNNLKLVKNYQLNRSKQGSLDNGFRDQVPHSNLSFSRPAGSFYSTTRDLYAFMRGLNNGTLINHDIKKEFVSKQVENLNIDIYKSWYGYGFYVNQRNGLLNYGHAGGMPGASSRCEYYPNSNIYIIVISNYNGAANLAANYISSLIK
ncbi:serine hydrolase domain-containing protein [Croceitalea marina]|uniref:Serine hydrolase domain-containing protein n=1 Tax=Croceitalea marina TaxID=1775166 RepID=A0ABW5N375_9FLAO